MHRRILQCIVLAGLANFPAIAQNYQSSFSEVKFDRAKTPSTLHGAATVDIPSGALSMDVPLGPGLGARGVRFTPKFSARFGPQTAPAQTGIDVNATQANAGGSTCTLTPGYLVRGFAATTDEFLLPDGTSGQRAATGFGNGWTGPSNIGQILIDFGLTNLVSSARIYGVGSNGELLLDLTYSGYSDTFLIYTYQPTKYYPNPDTLPVPRGVLVISADGKTATEYRYVNPQYASLWTGGAVSPAGYGYTPQTLQTVQSLASTTSSNPAHGNGNSGQGNHPGNGGVTTQLVSDGGGGTNPPPPNDLKCIHYLPVTWRNRFGDIITFNHAPNGGNGNSVDFDANWTRNGATLGSIQCRLQPFPSYPAAPALNTGGGPNGYTTAGARIQVAYTGVSLTTYFVDAFAPLTTTNVIDMSYVAWGTPRDKPWDYFRRNLQPVKLIVNSTGEYVQFGYIPGAIVNGMTVPVTLNTLAYPHRLQTYTWMPYQYRKTTGAYGWITRPDLYDAYTTAGVTQVVDEDLSSGGQTRVTTYQRVVPVPDPAYPSGPYWSSTAFWTAVTHPDGKVSVSRFAEPINTGQNGSTAQATLYQIAAHTKHLTVDTREYIAGQNWQADLTAQPFQSTAYRATQFGAPPSGTPGTPAAEANRFAVGFDWINPYWNFANLTSPNGDVSSLPYATRQETWENDGTGPVRHKVETRTNWDNTGLGWQTQTLVGDAGDAPQIRATSRNYQSDNLHWFQGRVTLEQKPGNPAVAFVYNSDGTVATAKLNPGGANEVDTNYTYTGLPDPSSVVLTSPSLGLSGSVGASYGFDSYGLVNAITPSGVAWSLGETHDMLGRPTQQSGANGETTTIQWDAAGRLSSVQPDPEAASVITYPDLLTAVATRGQQQTTYHYNGFGELVKVDRQGGSRTFQYDNAGRKTFESVWADNATGTTILYDSKGRVGMVTDPNGEVTQTIFEGNKKRIIHGGIETDFYYDGLNQLKQVIDALGQVSTYGYDDAGRVLQVQQTGSTGTQTRTWHYNVMGWLDQLTQPESGTTTYSDFTVQGKPRVTNYNGRTVTSQPDTLGRITAISSADGTISQIFVYGEEEPGHGLANNKLVRATSNGVVRVMDYNGARGRLSQLTRTVDGTSFVQGLGYDATYGFLSSRTYHDGRVQKLDYDWVKGVPASSGFGTNPGLSDLVAGLSYDPAGWGVTQMSWANGATSSFTYDKDQARLKTMTHNIPGQLFNKTWTYTYDPAGRLTNDTEDWYGYDPLGRLTSAFVRDPAGASGGLLQQFNYDTFGNRISLDSKEVTNWAVGAAPPTIPGAVTIPTIKAQTYAMTTGEATAMGATNHLPGTIGNVATGALYDAQGNLTRIYGALGQSSTQLTMTYDALARVTGLGDSLNATSQDYGYDDEGLRIRITDSRTGLTTYNIYNEARQLVAIYTKPGGGSLTWKKDIVYIGAKEVAEVSASGTSITLVDHLGSPRYQWNGSGTMLKQKFLPFGEQLGDPTSVANFAKGYTNHEQTDQSGLIYMQARFYAPGYGRFLSPDPARDQHFEETQSWNIYSYVQNNPTMRIDPNGMADDELPQMKAIAIKSAQNQAEQAQAQTARNAPAQTKTETATMSLVSRPIDTRDLPWWQKWLGAVDHAGWVIETKDASYVIQSGPNPQTGQNEANKVVATAPGKGQFEFSQVTDKKGETITARVNVLLTFKVSADAVSISKLQGLVSNWNDKGIKYNPYPGPNSNTFAHWIGSQMNLGSMQKVGYGLVHSLPGWGYLDQVR